MITQPKLKNNPLAGLMRQPKIYIKLPSGGEFWPENSLVRSETGEYPVYSMTAKDELMFKIPDALINGQAVVDVIQHCVPNIKNAWDIPNIDMDVILIAIRIATYGEKMTVPLANNDSDYDYDVDLRNIMANLIEQTTWDSVVPVSPELTVYVKPLNYKQMTESSMQSFETQKIIEIANNSQMKEEEKITLFKDTFNKLNNATVGIINDTVAKIESIQGSTDDPVYIREFMENCDREVFDAVKNHLEKLRLQNEIKPLQVQPTASMIASGFPDKIIEVPLVFDASTFFG
jgi:hypothetical protein